jgi:glycerol-3-phosphate dehydrogenase
LIHGGVRYLEKAVKQFDPGQLALVFDALHERATFLNIAPHLTRKLPIMTPCYSWWEIPYYWAGMKFYDALSFTRRLGSSRYASAKESAIQFPVIKTEGLKGSIVYFDGQMDDSRMNVSLALTAAVNGATIANHVEVVELLHKRVTKKVLIPPTPTPTPSSSASVTKASALESSEDSTPQDAAPINTDAISVANVISTTDEIPNPSEDNTTPSSAGALYYADLKGVAAASGAAEATQERSSKSSPATSNDVEIAIPQYKIVEEDKVCGAKVRDTITGETWDVHAETVVNATGPFVDHIRNLDAGHAVPKMITPSAGTHVVLPDYYAPIEMGMIIPKTEDGRVVFLIPWQGKVVAGTTDTACELSANPRPTESEIQFILKAIAGYTSVDVRREDVMAAWSGIRPLASNPNAGSTENLLRDHIIDVSRTGMLTITGGKWTTYRKMSSDVVDTLIKDNNFAKPLRDCTTENQLLIGASGWSKGLFMQLIQKFYRVKHTSGQNHKAPMNSDIAQHLSHSYGVRSFLVADLATKGYGKRLAHGHPYIEAEVVHAVQNEFAMTAVDVLARRLRLAFLDAEGAKQALPRTIDIMASLLEWDDAKKEEERLAALRFLECMQ